MASSDQLTTVTAAWLSGLVAQQETSPLMPPLQSKAPIACVTDEACRLTCVHRREPHVYRLANLQIPCVTLAVLGEKVDLCTSRTLQC